MEHKEVYIAVSEKDKWDISGLTELGDPFWLKRALIPQFTDEEKEGVLGGLHLASGYIITAQEEAFKDGYLTGFKAAIEIINNSIK